MTGVRLTKRDSPPPSRRPRHAAQGQVLNEADHRQAERERKHLAKVQLQFWQVRDRVRHVTEISQQCQRRDVADQIRAKPQHRKGDQHVVQQRQVTLGAVRGEQESRQQQDVPRGPEKEDDGPPGTAQAALEDPRAQAPRSAQRRRGEIELGRLLRQLQDPIAHRVIEIKSRHGGPGCRQARLLSRPAPHLAAWAQRPRQNRLTVQVPPQIGRQFARVGVPSAGFLLQALQADRVQIARHMTIQRAGRHDVLFLDLPQRFQHVGRLRLDRRAASQHFVEDRTQGIHVGRRRDVVGGAHGLFRRHVARRAHHVSGGRQ